MIRKQWRRYFIWSATALLSCAATSGEGRSPGAPLDSSAPPHSQETPFVNGQIEQELPWPDLSVPLARTGGGERDAAVVVGIERYDAVPARPGAVASAFAWHRYLTETLGVPNAILVPQKDATRLGVERALARAAELVKPGGRVWFVFIGHGTPEPGGTRGLLAPVDVRAEDESLRIKGMPLEEIVSTLEASDGYPILVLDACFSGLVTPSEFLVERVGPLEIVKPTKVRRATILAAAGSKQYAGELPGGHWPAFSYLTLGALRGWADADQDGEVTATEAISFSRSALAKFNRSQTPELVFGKFGDLKLASSHPSEKSPNIDGFARKYANDGGVAFNAEGIILEGVPDAQVKPLIFRQSQIPSDIKIYRAAEKQWQVFNDVRETVASAQAAAGHDRSGTRRRDGWCSMADLPEMPELDRLLKEQGQEGLEVELTKAETLCSQLTTYVQQRRRLIENMECDWEVVWEIMSFDSWSPEGKRAQLASFILTYGQLSELEELREARLMEDRLVAGKPARVDPEIELAKRVEVRDNKIVVSEPFGFVGRTARLQETSDGLLRAIVQVIRENPQILVQEVRTYTYYSSLSRRENQRLAEQRAKAVRRELIAMGVDPSSLTTKGYAADEGVDGLDDGFQVMHLNIVRQQLNSSTNWHDWKGRVRRTTVSERVVDGNFNDVQEPLVKTYAIDRDGSKRLVPNGPRCAHRSDASAR